jgi:hypothetical protein
MVGLAGGRSARELGCKAVPKQPGRAGEMAAGTRRRLNEAICRSGAGEADPRGSGEVAAKYFIVVTSPVRCCACLVSDLRARRRAVRDIYARGQVECAGFAVRLELSHDGLLETFIFHVLVKIGIQVTCVTAASSEEFNPRKVSRHDSSFECQPVTCG